MFTLTRYEIVIEDNGGDCDACKDEGDLHGGLREARIPSSEEEFDLEFD